MNSFMSGGLLGTGSGAYGNRNPFRGFWNTDPATQISSMSDPFQSRVNTMWNKLAPAGTAMPGTFGAWETAMQGYRGNGEGGGGGGGIADSNRRWRDIRRGGIGPGAGGGGGPGSGGGPGTPAPNQMTWAFPQYSQTWAFTPPPAPPLTMPPVFKKSIYENSGKEKEKKK